MKKFFITFFILLILGGAAFFFGWANFWVPPGAYGVISSKTHGIDPQVVQAGEFRWIWYKLIPTNARITAFRLDQKEFPLNFDSSLPSGDTYALFLGLNNIDFSFELKGAMSFGIKIEQLINITTQKNLRNQDDLDSFVSETAESIKLLILHYLSEAPTGELEAMLSGSRNIQLENYILSRFPEIRDFSFVINTAKYPDFVLYREIRAIYEEFLGKQREYITSSFGQRAEENIQTQLLFSELERYGELLTKYPILLDYLRLRDGVTP